MERGAWQATVHAITKSWTRLSDFYFILSCQGLKANFFLPLNIIPLYRCTNFLIHISIEEHLGYFQVWTAIKYSCYKHLEGHMFLIYLDK